MENKESLLNYLTALLDRDDVNCLKLSSYLSDLTAAKSEANNLIIKLTTLLTSNAFLSPATLSSLANLKVKLTKIKNYHINYSKQLTITIENSQTLQNTLVCSDTTTYISSTTFTLTTTTATSTTTLISGQETTL